MAEFYQLMAEGLGLRLWSPAYSYTHVAAAAAALIEGLALRQILAEAQRGNPGSRTHQHPNAARSSAVAGARATRRSRTAARLNPGLLAFTQPEGRTTQTIYLQEPRVHLRWQNSPR